MEWHPKNYFDLPYTSPVVVIILGANGHTGEKYAKVLCRYISNKGWKACVIIRFVFSVSIYFGGIGVLFGLLRSYKDNRRKCLIVKVAYNFEGRDWLKFRKGFGEHNLNTKKFMNLEEFEEIHTCVKEVNSHFKI